MVFIAVLKVENHLLDNRICFFLIELLICFGIVEQADIVFQKLCKENGHLSCEVVPKLEDIGEIIAAPCTLPCIPQLPPKFSQLISQRCPLCSFKEAIQTEFCQDRTSSMICWTISAHSGFPLYRTQTPSTVSPL